MKIEMLTSGNVNWIQGAAALLKEAFPHSWRDMDAALEEVEGCLKEEKVALVTVEHGQVLGFIGGQPRYGTTGWELHPLVVSKARQREGIGRELVAALEAQIANRGGVMVYLGSDDENGSTNLSNCDLWHNLFLQTQNIRNLHNHPFEFYQKQGYQIVGVLPDANGIGKPDIYMAKRL